MKPSNKKVPAKSTAGAFGGCESTWKTGHQAEDWVLEHYRSNGYDSVKRRWRTPFGEIDLWLRHPQRGDLFLEVKTLRSPEYLERRMSLKQAQKMRRHCLWMAERFSCFQFRVVYVSPARELIEIGLQDL